MVRSCDGNLPNLLLRISAFKKALGSLVSCGLSRRQRSNPTASLRILTLYGTPVLMSGLASLVLSPGEISSLDQQYKRTMQALLKLSSNSPTTLVSFIAGSLPGTAILHLRQLSLFGMICHLPGDPLHHLAHNTLLTLPSTAKSWFIQVRNLLLQYSLPHPLLLLESPPFKMTFKNLVKAKVIDYWESKLRMEASFLPSLQYFNPEYMSLKTPHRLLSSAGHKSYEVAKARIQLLFLSNQYPSNNHTRHWSPQNPQGICSYPPCLENNIIESNEHILLSCPAYTDTRVSLFLLCLRTKHPAIHQLIASILSSKSHTKMMQFLLDCSSLPEVIRAAQVHGDQVYNHLFYLTRSWCFSLHRDRMKRLGKWKFR